METYYFDTSALVKLYLSEPGSRWIDQIVNAQNRNGQPVHVITISKIGIVETAAALALRRRTGFISLENQHELYRSLLRDSQKLFEFMALTDPSIYLAADLTQRYSLRGYDAVHLASAILLNQRILRAGSQPLIFVSADQRLCQTAITESLIVENPSNHP